jgi:6-hydroxynicotinate 3-monooxygenase
MHRGDLQAALAAAVPPEHIVFNKKLVGLDRKGAGVDIWADAVVGADGVHSLVRETPFGPEKLVFTGRVAHCTVFPAGLLGNFVVDGCAKWWDAWQTPLVRPHLRAAG